MISQVKPSHAHECPACGHVWFHGNECAGNMQAHVCTGCGHQGGRYLHVLNYLRIYYDRSAQLAVLNDGRTNTKVKNFVIRGRVETERGGAPSFAIVLGKCWFKVVDDVAYIFTEAS